MHKQTLITAAISMALYAIGGFNPSYAENPETKGNWATGQTNILNKNLKIEDETILSYVVGGCVENGSSLGNTVEILDNSIVGGKNNPEIPPDACNGLIRF